MAVAMRVMHKVGSWAAAVLAALGMAVVAAAPANATESAQATESARAIESDSFPGTMEDFQEYWFTDVANWWTSIGVDSAAYYVFPATAEGFSTACGNGPDDAAAFYCAADDTVVFSQPLAIRIWEGTLDVTGQFGGQAAGDMGVVYALAHEYAHNVQHEVGILDAGYPVIAVELHADCWAGVYSRAKEDAGQLDATDVDEAITTAARVGDYDYANPAFHGTPEQRVAAFEHGFAAGEPLACDAVLSESYTG